MIKMLLLRSMFQLMKKLFEGKYMNANLDKQLWRIQASDNSLPTSLLTTQFLSVDTKSDVKMKENYMDKKFR